MPVGRQRPVARQESGRHADSHSQSPRVVWKLRRPLDNTGVTGGLGHLGNTQHGVGKHGEQSSFGGTGKRVSHQALRHLVASLAAHSSEGDAAVCSGPDLPTTGLPVKGGEASGSQRIIEKSVCTQQQRQELRYLV
jgi:hypothetical protein